MTVLTERRGEVSGVAWFLIVAFLVAAWRGAGQDPVLAGGMGLLAGVGLTLWLVWRLRPALELTITPDAVTWGRPGRELSRIPRTAGPLSFRRSIGIRMQAHWWLAASRDSGAPAIIMRGYDMDQVRQACLEHGWEFLR